MLRDIYVWRIVLLGAFLLCGGVTHFWPGAMRVTAPVALAILGVLVLSYLPAMFAGAPADLDVESRPANVGVFLDASELVIADSQFKPQTTIAARLRSAPIVLDLVSEEKGQMVAGLHIGADDGNGDVSSVEFSIDGGVLVIYDAAAFARVPEVDRKALDRRIAESFSDEPYFTFMEADRVWALACITGAGDGIYTLNITTHCDGDASLTCEFLPEVYEPDHYPA